MPDSDSFPVIMLHFVDFSFIPFLPPKKQGKSKSKHNKSLVCPKCVRYPDANITNRR